MAIDISRKATEPEAIDYIITNVWFAALNLFVLFLHSLSHCCFWALPVPAPMFPGRWSLCVLQNKCCLYVQPYRCKTDCCPATHRAWHLSRESRLCPRIHFNSSPVAGTHQGKSAAVLPLCLPSSGCRDSTGGASRRQKTIQLIRTIQLIPLLTNRRVSYNTHPAKRAKNTAAKTAMDDRARVLPPVATVRAYPYCCSLYWVVNCFGFLWKKKEKSFFISFW